jgi:hypothetical protein
VRARWRFDFAGTVRQQLVTSTVPLAWSLGRWRPASVPALALGHGPGRSTSGAASAGACG